MPESCYDVVEMETHAEANRAVTAKANALGVKSNRRFVRKVEVTVTEKDG